MITDVAAAQQLARIRQSIDFVNQSRAFVGRAIAAAPDGPAHAELVDAIGDLDDVQGHLERALRLTDPAAADPLARRADESRTPAGS